MSIYHLAEVIGSETKPEDQLVSGSSGSGIEIFLLACPTRTGQRIYHTAGLGAMGFGLPMSHCRLPRRRPEARPSASTETAVSSSTFRNSKPWRA